MDRTDPRPLRVLAVDDNRDAADSVRLLAQIWGHEARAAYDGPAALAAVADFDPDVLLLDLGLPRMDGFEIARRVRAGSSRATLVAVTGYTDPDVQRRAMDAGFVHTLLKPVEPAALREFLDAAGRLPALARETRALATQNADLIRQMSALTEQVRRAVRGLRDDLLPPADSGG
jgi:CheY-like chemotaxis protein